MLKAVKMAAAATTIAVAAVAVSGTAQARFDSSLATEAQSLLQPVYYYGYGYRGYYAPRYYAPRYYGYYPRYYAPRYYRYY